MASGVSTASQFFQPIFEDIYNSNFDLSRLSDEQREQIKQHGIRGTFPVAAVVILHFVTCGLFSLIYFGLKHSELPRLKHNDFGAGRAIGFSFIPIFNIYWVFMFWVRLVNRINLQFRLRGAEDPVPKGLIITSLVFSCIPVMNIISAFILLPICAGMIGSACNQLALGEVSEF